MKFEKLDVSVPFRQLPVAWSRRINQELRAFVGPATAASGDVAVRDDEAARFLTHLAYRVLRDVYGLAERWNQPPEWFEEVVSVSEILEFWEHQIEANGPGDFLLQPLRLIVQGMRNVANVADNVMARAISETPEERK